MKKIFTLAFVALTLLATACGKNNNDTPSTPQNDAKKALIGTWKIEASFVNGKEIELTECSKKEYLEITQDSFSVFFSESCILKETKNSYTVLGNVITLDNGIKTTFSIENNKLTIIPDENNKTIYLKK
ncbi:lipocalin family protein [Capnocytophaga sp. oral taxon 903]|jgi:lipoprotein|uniref:lipocalin family protein n=1 Tax=Capnocytophaga sp. oral taxon 903 TaxID=2748317 RepID=UPI0015BE4FDC|nr:lipocalin family protein [Capnocytophaga sp. oral taxon 903]NWO29422.1 lipocalin family protein [Capnocytophaga sp. oral taxon 903]